MSASKKRKGRELLHNINMQKKSALDKKNMIAKRLQSLRKSMKKNRDRGNKKKKLRGSV